MNVPLLVLFFSLTILQIPIIVLCSFTIADAGVDQLGIKNRTIEYFMLMVFIALAFLISSLISALRTDEKTGQMFFQSGRFTFESRGGVVYILILLGSLVLFFQYLYIKVLSELQNFPILSHTKLMYIWLVFYVIGGLYYLMGLLSRTYSCSNCQYTIRLFEPVPKVNDYCPNCDRRFSGVVTHYES